jgi:hypothetical protein
LEFSIFPEILYQLLTEKDLTFALTTELMLLAVKTLQSLYEHKLKERKKPLTLVSKGFVASG